MGCQRIYSSIRISLIFLTNITPMLPYYIIDLTINLISVMGMRQQLGLDSVVLMPYWNRLEIYVYIYTRTAVDP